MQNIRGMWATRTAGRGMLFLGLTLFCSNAFSAAAPTAGSAGDGIARPLDGGVVYPSLYDAISRNPSALTQDQRTIFRGEWNSPSSTYSTGAFSEGLAYSSGSFGAGANIVTAIQGNSLALKNSNIGIGVGFGGASLGVNTALDLTGATTPAMNLALSIMHSNGFTFLMLLKSIESFTTSGGIVFGMGLGSPRKYQVEITLDSSIFSSLRQSILSTSGILYFGFLGLGAYASYTTNVNSNSFAVGGGASVNLGSRVSFSTKLLTDSVTGMSTLINGTVCF